MSELGLDTESIANRFVTDKGGQSANADAPDPETTLDPAQ
jgi:hypothetical protein